MSADNTYKCCAKATAALKLLEATPDESYLKEWLKLLSHEQEAFKEEKETPVVIFRLGEQWLAMSATILSKVMPRRKVHRIPHKSNDLIMGLINMDGVLVLCFSLHHLLQVKHNPEGGLERAKGRMLCVEDQSKKWVFAVDEIFGIYHCSDHAFENVPVTLSKTAVNYLKGIFSWNEKTVGFLDDELLFANLRRASGG